jgi:4-amino-4-deoxy-L-arabinose transferase-like glycosyltransferase
VTENRGDSCAPAGREGGDADRSSATLSVGTEQPPRRRWIGPGVLFGLSLAVYLVTRLVGLDRFPIYFFTDEAAQTMHAADFVRDGFRNWDGVLLPTYFRNGEYYNLGVSVYAQVPAYLLFGKSVFATRATSALITVLAAAAIALILRNIFRVPYWWAGAMLLAIAPSWFLHSRTAFETAEFVSFYAAALYAYLLYRYSSPRYLYAALVLGALAFYTYSAGQVVLAVTGVLLLVSDAGYHWRHRRTVLAGLGLVVLLALPYVRFRLSHVYSPSEHLATLYSYWVRPIPLKEKLAAFGSEYWRGLSPAFWFGRTQVDLPRHLMKGYGNLLVATAPFFALGLLLALRNYRSAAYRAALVTLVAAPSGAALVRASVPRLLVFVVPATLLTALGLSKALAWAGRAVARARKSSPEGPGEQPVLAVVVFCLLAAVGLGMLGDALLRGPVWFRDYGLGGMQWGARQVFGRVRADLARDPGATVLVSPNWLNGADVLARFFLYDPLPVSMEVIDGFMKERRPLGPDTLFVMTADEYERAVKSGKFADIRVEDRIRYPDGRPGFYFVRLAYSDAFDRILAEETAERRRLAQTPVTIDGAPLVVRHSKLDLGDARAMFDDNPATVARTAEANPFVVEWEYAEPRTVRELEIGIGEADENVAVRLSESRDAEPVTYTAKVRGTIQTPTVLVPFPRPTRARFVRIELYDPDRVEPDHIHIFDIRLR